MGAVVQVKPVSLGFAGTPLLSLVLQCFRVEILDIYSELRAQEADDEKRKLPMDRR